MRARAIEDIFRARKSQAPREGLFTKEDKEGTPAKVKKIKKAKKTATKQQQPGARIWESKEEAQVEYRKSSTTTGTTT